VSVLSVSRKTSFIVSRITGWMADATAGRGAICELETTVVSLAVLLAPRMSVIASPLSTYCKVSTSGGIMFSVQDITSASVVICGGGGDGGGGEGGWCQE